MGATVPDYRIELLLSESRVRVFKIEDELKYIYENEEMDSGN